VAEVVVAEEVVAEEVVAEVEVEEDVMLRVPKNGGVAEMLRVPKKQFEKVPFPFLLKANIKTNN
jgi:hypothetical protein